MLYTFNIVPSMNLPEVDNTFVLGLVKSAEEVSTEACQTAEQAWALCEYLDSVDAGTLTMDKPLYRQCVARLSEYLGARLTDESAMTLANRSWAANTLVSVLREMADEQSSCKWAA